MQYKINHKTLYHYSAPVSHCHNSVYMTPRDTYRQSCINNVVAITPGPCSTSEKRDQYDNAVLDFSIYKPHDYLEVIAESVVETNAVNWLDMLDNSLSCEQVLQQIFNSSTAQTLDAINYLPVTNLTIADSEISAFSETIFTRDKPFIEALQELNRWIYEQLSYDSSLSNVTTSASQVMLSGAGVCQDFAHFAISVLRAAGYPARYISGYIETLPPEGVEKLVGADATHAWFAVYLPEQGWLEFDPTNNMLASERHLITAWGRDYNDVAPLSGVISGGGYSVQLEVSVDVTLAG